MGDVGDWDTHVRAADAAERRGPLRHWVNNAGIDIVGGAHEVTPEHIEQGLRVLQHGVMFGCAIAVRRMLPARMGSIVNISSIQGVAAWPRYFVYDAAKAAILMATKSVALDYAPHGLRCNVVLPGNIDTPMFRAGSPRILGATRGSRARPPWRRCCGSAGRRRSPTWWRFSVGSSLVRERRRGDRRRRRDGAVLRSPADRRRVGSRSWPGYA